jgi:deoxyribodipyrimidine photo-lyase
MPRLALWWIRRDLRLTDNPALTVALAHAQTVIPVFILDPVILNSPYHHAALKRTAFLFGGLRELAADLHTRGSRLTLRHGQPLDVLSALMAETGASAIFAAEDFSPYARQRDARITRHLPLTLVSGLTVHHPSAVRKANGEPYTVFTPFRRAWKALPAPNECDLLPAPTRLNPPPNIASRELPAVGGPVHFLPGEVNARATLCSFVGQSIFAYSAGRNRLDGDGTSALSPYLRFGMISAREAVVTAHKAIASAADAQAKTSAEAWLTELIWREFYCAILYHFPEVLQRAFRPKLRHIAWADDKSAFAMWCEGRTGYPVVDSAMRQLAETGWMHNRARMITASFLVKDLLIDWRWGEHWFMQHLVDGDPAANNGGWQWTAGVGTDAAPYFRVFNPIVQSQKFDPHGDFARAWLPELSRVPDEYIHEPWKMPADVQRQAHCVIGIDYPTPIVDHAFARQRVLAAYRQGQSNCAPQV